MLAGFQHSLDRSRPDVSAANRSAASITAFRRHSPVRSRSQDTPVAEDSRWVTRDSCAARPSASRSLMAVRATAGGRNSTRRWGEGALAAGKPLFRISVGFRLGVGGAPEHAAIEQPPVGCHGLEEQTIARDLRDHEMMLGNSRFVEFASAE